MGTSHVLNAFRHQRTVHPAREQGPAAARCAQRLSASTNCSRSHRTEPHRNHGVLNAFRHQRTVHRRPHSTTGIAVGAQRLSASTNCSLLRLFESEVCGRVLNAFRHQRTVHENRRDNKPGSLIVLNAFRHQLTVHRCPGDRPHVVQIQCSTPFGINELFTLARCR